MANNENLILCSSQTTPALEASSWNNIKQDSPNTVYNFPGTLEAASSGNGAYEGSSGSKKAVIYFASPLPAGTYLIMPFDLQSYLENAVTFESSLFASGGTPISVGISNAIWTIRIRQITALPPIEGQNLTWNTFSGFTMDSGLTFTDFMRGNFVLTWTGSNLLIEDGDETARIYLPTLKLTVVSQLFGLVIDCKLAIATPLGFPMILLSSAATLSGGVPINNSTNRNHIYARKMA